MRGALLAGSTIVVHGALNAASGIAHLPGGALERVLAGRKGDADALDAVGAPTAVRRCDALHALTSRRIANRSAGAVPDTVQAVLTRLAHDAGATLTELGIAAVTRLATLNTDMLECTAEHPLARAVFVRLAL
jgi:hypothetical protein